ncbi:MAG: hypothetical protein JWP45_2899 [Mucilaginibacter sp.]|nr:hypothetical protein [Mucilaginibacter sp.]
MSNDNTFIFPPTNTFEENVKLWAERHHLKNRYWIISLNILVGLLKSLSSLGKTLFK